MGTGGDRVAIDPDDLVPYLGTDMGESVKQSRRPTTSCPQPQKGLTTSKSFNLCCSTRSQPSTALTAEGFKAGNIFSSWMEKPRSGLGHAGSGQVVELRQESGLCPLPHLVLLSLRYHQVLRSSSPHGLCPFLPSEVGSCLCQLLTHTHCEPQQGLRTLQPTLMPTCNLFCYLQCS